jgi:hypothetical protein
MQHVQQIANDDADPIYIEAYNCANKKGRGQRLIESVIITVRATGI